MKLWMGIPKKRISSEVGIGPRTKAGGALRQ